MVIQHMGSLMRELRRGFSGDKKVLYFSSGMKINNPMNGNK